MLEFVFRPAMPPIPNGIGGEWYFDPPAPRKTYTRSRKEVRRDFMTGVAAAMRDIERCKPIFVFGLGQGAVIVAGLTKPRVVEAALATRVVQDWEGPTLARAWNGVKAAALTKPAIHAVSLWERLSLAVP